MNGDGLMDPDAALTEIRELTIKILAGKDAEGDAVRLAELIAGLDEWLSKGGFAPAAWKGRLA
jgi:hypothetical protein